MLKKLNTAYNPIILGLYKFGNDFQLKSYYIRINTQLTRLRVTQKV